MAQIAGHRIPCSGSRSDLSRIGASSRTALEQPRGGHDSERCVCRIYRWLGPLTDPLYSLPHSQVFRTQVEGLGYDPDAARFFAGHPSSSSSAPLATPLDLSALRASLPLASPLPALQQQHSTVQAQGSAVAAWASDFLQQQEVHSPALGEKTAFYSARANAQVGMVPGVLPLDPIPSPELTYCRWKLA